MTRLLLRINDLADAEAAARGGADCVDIALSDVQPALRVAFPRILRLRAASAADLAAARNDALAIGADEIAAPYHVLVAAGGRLAGGHPSPASGGPALVAIFGVDDLLAPLSSLAGFVDAVVVDTRPGERLIDAVPIARLDAFARAVRALGLPFGLTGGLEPPDVARLLVLRPDLLGFDRAARRDQRADGPVVAEAVATLRALIPREVPRDPGSGAAPAAAEVIDHIFVHDFVARLAIGAYQAEHGMRQRVRFSVDADVRRPAEPPADMRDVFSYDIIIETIRVLAERPHVTFVETLAEEVAASLLAYPQLTRVTIKVEKLDVIEGSVGIIVRRDRHGRRGA